MIPLSARARTLIDTIAKIDRISRDIMDGASNYEPGDIRAMAKLLDEQAFDWMKDICGEGVSVEAQDAMSVLASRIQDNIDCDAEAASRHACRVHHAEMAIKSAAAMGG